MWIIFKVFTGFVTILLLFRFGFDHKILALQPRIEQTPPALEGKVLTTGLPGNSCRFFKIILFIYEMGLCS